MHIQQTLAGALMMSLTLIATAEPAPPEIMTAAALMDFPQPEAHHVLAYGDGPLQFGEVLGPRNVLRILDSLYRFYGDPRYRASPWLRRRAMLGISLLTTEI